MLPVLFSIGPLHVYSWGLCLAIAIIVAWIGVGRKFKEKGLEPDYVVECIVAMVVCGIIGGRSLYILVFQWQDFLANPLSVLNMSDGIRGLIWYGSFAGGFLAFVAYTRFRKIGFLAGADMFAPYVALGYAIVRVGCFLNGCCYGLPTDSIIGVHFPEVDSLARYPTQLFSSAASLLIFVILIKLYAKRRFDGQVFAVYLVLYGTYRFIVEFFRFNVIYFGIFSWAQAISAAVFLAGLILYFWSRRHISLENPAVAGKTEGTGAGGASNDHMEDREP